MSKRTNAPPTPPREYLELIKQFPLRPLRDETDYDNATAIADGLAGLIDRTRDQEDYLAVLFRVIEDYETVHHPIE